MEHEKLLATQHHFQTRHSWDTGVAVVVVEAQVGFHCNIEKCNNICLGICILPYQHRFSDKTLRKTNHRLPTQTSITFMQAVKICLLSPQRSVLP